MSGSGSGAGAGAAPKQKQERKDADGDLEMAVPVQAQAAAFPAQGAALPAQGAEAKTPPRKRKADGSGGSAAKKAKFDHADREEKLAIKKRDREDFGLEARSLKEQVHTRDALNARRPFMTADCCRVVAAKWRRALLGKFHFDDFAHHAFVYAAHASVHDASHKARTLKSKELLLGQDVLSFIFVFLTAREASRFRAVSRSAYHASWRRQSWAPVADLGFHLGHVSDMGLLRAGFAVARPEEIVIDEVYNSNDYAANVSLLSRDSQSRFKIAGTDEHSFGVARAYAQAMRLEYCASVGMQHSVTTASLKVMASGPQLWRLVLGGCFSITPYALNDVLGGAYELSELAYQDMYAAATDRGFTNRVLDFSGNPKLTILSLLVEDNSLWHSSWSTLLWHESKLEELHLATNAYQMAHSSDWRMLDRLVGLRVLTLTNMEIMWPRLLQLRNSTKLEHLGLLNCRLVDDGALFSEKKDAPLLPATLTSLHLVTSPGGPILRSLVTQADLKLQELVLCGSERTIHGSDPVELPYLKTLRCSVALTPLMICPVVEECELFASLYDDRGAIGALTRVLTTFPALKRVLVSLDAAKQVVEDVKDYFTMGDLVKTAVQCAAVKYRPVAPRSVDVYLPWQMGEIPKKLTQPWLHRGPKPVPRGRPTRLQTTVLGQLRTAPSDADVYSRVPCALHPRQARLSRWMLASVDNEQ